jgi:Fic family protein
MQSLSRKYLDTISLSVEQASTLKAIGECKGKQDLYIRQTPEALESLQQVAIIESSESSNRLEGITAPHERIKALALQSTKPKNRSEQEIAGYRDALTLIHQSAEHMPFTTNVVLQLHSLVYRYMPDEGGRWKAADNEIIEYMPDGSMKRVRFKAVPAVATPQAMDDLARLYKEAIDQHGKEPLVIVPLVILDFLCIHPFRDGNGRVGRLLTLLLLYHFGYRVGRYISLERLFEESRETYYETLEASSQCWHESNHDPFPWLDYFWGVVLRAYRDFEERVGKIRSGKGAKTDQIKLAVVRQIGPFAISDIERQCPTVSRDMIRHVLRQLRDEGLIAAKGKGRGAKWVRQQRAG